MATPTTRIEIADLIESTFDGTPRRSNELVAAARVAGARQRVMDALSTLPDKKYLVLSELWQHLPDLEIEP